MKTWTMPAKRKYIRGEWYRWFAWRPVKVYITPDLTPKTHTAPWKIVWLERIERRELSDSDVFRLEQDKFQYLIRYFTRKGNKRYYTLRMITNDENTN